MKSESGCSLAKWLASPFLTGCQGQLLWLSSSLSLSYFQINIKKVHITHRFLKTALKTKRSKASEGKPKMHTKDSPADQRISLAYYIHKFLSFNNNRITLLFWQRYEES